MIERRRTGRGGRWTAAAAGAAALAATAAGAVPALAYTPLEIGGRTISWGSSRVSYGIGWERNDDWDAALRAAFGAWNAALGSSLELVEDPALRGRADTSAPSHLVVLDESNATGWFTDASFVAVTPIWTDAGGRILDADILLNGRDFSFATDGAPRSYDLQAILAHEIGHFIGFDHSAICNATIFPYVRAGDPTPRALSSDEVAAARSLAPAGSTRLRGRVVRAGNGAGIPGAHVVALDAGGRALASVLTRGDGRFDLVGLDPGAAVRVFAEPLDGPVTGLNVFTSVQSDFQTTERPGGPFALGPGQDLDLGTVACGTKQVSVTGFFAPELTPGDERVVTLVASGLTDGGAAFTVLGLPGVSVLEANSFGTTWQITVAASPEAEPGLRTLHVKENGRVAIVPGAIEVVGHLPKVTEMSPASGSMGTLATVTGAGFRAGAVVTVGGRLAGDVAVLDPERLQLTVPAGVTGPVTLTVQNPDGRFVRVLGGFTYEANGEPGGDGGSTGDDWDGWAGGDGGAGPGVSEAGGGGAPRRSSSKLAGCALGPVASGDAPERGGPGPILAVLAVLAVLVAGRRRGVPCGWRSVGGSG